MTNQAQPQNPIGGAPGVNFPSFSQILQKIKRDPKLPILIGVPILATVLGIGVLFSSSVDYQTIYSSLSEADGGKIVSELERRSIPFEISNGGQTIKVPADQVYLLRLQLAEMQLPAGGNVGFELMDKQAFGISQFSEHVNFQRSLEGELAKTIESLGPVARARVHLVMPKESVFVRDRQPASASVVLHLHPGRTVSDGQIEAVTHMVSSGVQGLPSDAVTVVDQSGRLLTKNNGSEGFFDEEKLNYTDEIQSNIQKRIETILSPILGPKNVRAQVVADVDFARREQTSERFNPNTPPDKASIRSQQIAEDYNGDANQAKGVPGALSNTIPNSPAITDDKGNPNAAYPQEDPEKVNVAGKDGKNISTVIGTNASMRSDKTINYELDKTIEHVKSERGNILRLSAAVVVNYKEITDENDEVKKVPLTPEEIENVKRLVRQAMGYSPERGDALEVVNSPFSELEAVGTDDPWWKTPEGLSLINTIARYVMLVLIALVVWMAVIRPARRRQEEARIQRQEAVRMAEQGLISTSQPGEGGEDEIQYDDQGNPIPSPVRSKKRQYENSLRGFRSLAEKDPQLVASILKQWLS